MSTLNFRQHQAWGEMLLRWWQGLDNNRSGRAALRRAPDITAVVMVPVYHQLHHRLVAAGWPDSTWRNDRLAAVAGLLAHVKKNVENPLPKSMSEGDKPRVSPLRFMRLLESPDIDTLFAGLRRTLPLLDHQIDVLALATDVVNWDDSVKKRWAYDYDWPQKAGA